MEEGKKIKKRLRGGVTAGLNYANSSLCKMCRLASKAAPGVN